MVGLKDELLKAIWHAFTALDLDRSGKVSKSQLKARRGAGLGRGARGHAAARSEAGRGPSTAFPPSRPPGPWLCGAAVRVEPPQRPARCGAAPPPGPTSGLRGAACRQESGAPQRSLIWARTGELIERLQLCLSSPPKL